MKLIKKVFKRVVLFIFSKYGYSTFAARKITKEIFDDLLKNKNTTFKQKLWAYRRGFLSDKIEAYGMTEENFKDYLSDFVYWNLHPINGIYSKWIDDKLTTKYILHPFNEYLPKYFLHINSGRIYCLPDCPLGIKENIDGIISLLIEQKNLALKLVAGSLGEGFYKLSVDSGSFYVNGKEVQESIMLKFLKKLDGYIVTEYLTSHEYVRKIYAGAPNTLRVMVINETGSNPILANAFMRFGTHYTGVVDNVSVGGICAIVNVENGQFYNPVQFVNHKIVDCKVHPDTKEVISGVLPHWNLIKRTLLEISRYIPQIKYFGYDVVITEVGFKILEINSLQDIKWFQFNYPLLRNNICEDFFANMTNNTL
jgi:hypothetical protein